MLVSTHKHLVFLFILCSLLILAACTRSTGEDYLENYLDRLSNVTGVEIPKTEPVIKFGFPRLKQKSEQFSLERDSKIGLLQFLSLSGCELQSVIGQKNSSLGKLAPASQQLISELHFLRVAPACLKTLGERDNDELTNKITKAVTDKRANLNKSIWHTVLNSKEAKAFWSTKNTQPDYPSNTSIEVVQAIQSLDLQTTEMISGNYKVDGSLLEHNLSILNRGDGGALYSSLSKYKTALLTANTMLDELLNGNCKVAGQTINLSHFNNVVEKFFVGEVQVWAAQLSQRYYSLINAIQALERSLANAESSTYHHWRLRRDKDFESAVFSSRPHVAKIKKINDLCAG